MSTQIEFVPVDLIDPHPHNPRRDLGDLTELAASIKSQGIRQNLLVTPWGDQGRYRAIIGHRRLAASKLAGFTEVPAVIDEDISAEGQIELMLLENLQRTEISPIEEAEGYQQLLDLGMKPAAIAKATGRKAITVNGRLKLMKLSESVREKVHTHEATLDDAADLLKLEDRPDLLEMVAVTLGTPNFAWKLRDALSTRKRDLDRAPLLARIAELGVQLVTMDERKLSHVSLGAVETLAELDEIIAEMGDAGLGDAADVRYAVPEYDTRIYLRRLVARDESAEAARAAERETQSAERDRLTAEAESLYELRDEWVRAFCSRKRIAAKDQLAIMAIVGPFTLAGGIHHTSFQVDEWLRPGIKTDYPDLHVRLARVAEAFPGADPSGFLLGALHIAAGTPWTNAYDRVESVALYALLEQLGYPVSDAERARITPPAEDEAVEA